MLNVVKKHTNAAKRIPITMHKAWHPLIERAPEVWIEALDLGKQFGFRNAQVTVLAPTGTISFLMSARTTGIEPDLAILVYKKLVGGGLAVMPNESVDPALRNLGYDAGQRVAILEFIKEKGTIHGAPGFDDERHGSIFAEALGDHALRPEAHILMMGAVQPFLSGGISKTVNLHKTAKVEDIERIYMLAWKEGLKCVAVYRDGCKLSQPISTDASTTDASKKKLAWGERKKMPALRDAKTMKITLGGTELYITPGFFEDGTLGEIFVRVAKQGSTLNGIIDAWATAFSIGLQHGVPLETLIEKNTDQEFQPNGYTDHAVIRRARSIVDLVAQWLALEYAPGARHLLRLRESDVSATKAMRPEQAEARSVEDRQAQETILGKASFGPPCTRCGNLTKRAGTCFTCTSCGDTSGCS
jgi:ribonucleoside-diphosphate reductase alpha chain